MRIWFWVCALLISAMVSALGNQNPEKINKSVPPPTMSKKENKSIVVEGSFRQAMRRCRTSFRDVSRIVIPVSDRYGMDWKLVTAVIAAESSFNACATSPRGAAGLMQVTPDLAQKYRIDAHELYEPEKNIHVGVRHLKKLSNRYNGDLVLTVAAYNAGEGAVDRFGGVPPYKETQAFVQKVLDYHSNLQDPFAQSFRFPSLR